MTRQLSLGVLLVVVIASFCVLSFFSPPIISPQETQWEGMVQEISVHPKYVLIRMDEVLVTGYYLSPKIQAGDRIRVYGLISDVRLSEQERSYERTKLAKGIFYTMKAKNIELIEKNYNAYTIRDTIVSWLDRKIDTMYTQDAPIVKALLYGDRSELTKEQKNTFAQSGTSHIFALSGFHVGIIALGINALLARIGVRKRGCIVLVVLALYAFLTGLKPSILRAVGFFAVLYLSFLTGKKYNLLATANGMAALLLVYHPYYLYDIGFVLSFSGVISIALFYPLLKDLTAGWRFSQKKIFSSLLLVIAVQILTLPLGMYYFGQVSLVAIPANLVVIPILSFVMGLSIVSLALHILAGVFPLWYTLDEGLIATVHFLIRRMVQANEFFASLPYAFAQEKFIGPFQLAAVYIVILSLYLVWERKKIKESVYEPQRAGKVIIEEA